MKKEEIYNAWTEFINNDKYREYFVSDLEVWFENFEKVKQFIDKNCKRPSKHSKNKEEKILACWIGTQLKNYKTKINILKKEEIYNAWTDFISDEIYKEYLFTDEEKWYTNLEKIKQFIDENSKRPSTHSKNEYEKKLATWMNNQLTNYKTKINTLKKEEIYDAWSDFINDKRYSEYFESDKKKWYNNLKKLKQFIDDNSKTPSNGDKPKDEKILGSWLSWQKSNYKKKIKSMKEPKIYDAWTKFITDPKYKKYFDTSKSPQKNMSKADIEPKQSKQQIKVERQQRVQSELSQLHQKYKTMNSQNLATLFKESPKLWHEYHKISDENEESFPEEEIPRNLVIKYLENLPGNKGKVIADMGCGHAQINKHFQYNERFSFENFDHIASSELVTVTDISHTGLDDYSVDIAILSLAMWGSNCKNYVSEAYRILDKGGQLLIIEPFKRWNNLTDENDTIVNRLKEMLIDNNFIIVEEDIKKFMFIKCQKH